MEEVFYCPGCHEEFDDFDDLSEHMTFCEEFNKGL